MLLISFYQTSEFHRVRTCCAARLCSHGLTLGHTCTQIPSLWFSWPPGFVCCQLALVLKGTMKTSRLCLSHSLSCLWQAEEPQCIQLFLISKFTYTFASLKFLFSRLFIQKVLLFVNLHFIYKNWTHWDFIQCYNNTFIFILCLFLISLILFVFCHMSSHRVIEIVIKTLNHQKFEAIIVCMKKSSSQYSSYSGLVCPLEGLFFCIDSCP